MLVSGIIQRNKYAYASFNEISEYQSFLRTFSIKLLRIIGFQSLKKKSLEVYISLRGRGDIHAVDKLRLNILIAFIIIKRVKIRK